MTADRPLLLTSLALVLLAGCAAVDPNVVRRQSCHYDGAYEDGLNAGREGKEMSSRYLEVCDAAALAEARRGYREGFVAGLAARADEQRAQAEAQRAAAAVAEGQLAAAMLAPNWRDFTCEVSAALDRFVSYGPSEAEAGAAAKARCEHAHPGWPCWPVSCRKNSEREEAPGERR